VGVSQVFKEICPARKQSKKPKAGLVARQRACPAVGVEEKIGYFSEL
jgi:hypothetical protein